MTFDYKLIALVVLVSLTLRNWTAGSGQPSKFSQTMGELLFGCLLGLVLGIVWNLGYYPGIITLGALTFAVLSLNSITRLLALISGLGTAVGVYYFYWGSTLYLVDSLLNDFR